MLTVMLGTKPSMAIRAGRCSDDRCGILAAGVLFNAK